MPRFHPHAALTETPPLNSPGRAPDLWWLAAILLLSTLLPAVNADARGSDDRRGSLEGQAGNEESLLKESESVEAPHDGPADDSDPAHPPETESTNGFQRAVDKIHAGISAGVEDSARRVDSFFADDRFYTDATDSYLRVSGQTTFEDGEDDRSQARVRMRLDLPGTRERLRVFVEGGDPDDGDDATSETIPDALDDADYNIGIEMQIPDTEKWDLRPAIGVKASSSPDPFIRMRAIRYERLNGWLFRFATGISEFVDDGTEVGARVDFDRKLNPDWLFRTTTRAEYRDSKDRIEALQQFSLFQKVNDRVGFAYDVGVRADDDPDWEVDQYFTQFRSRFRVYRKWLFLELKPQIVFREEDDYDASFLFSVRLDVIFGEQYREGIRRAPANPAAPESAPSGT
jgi:hypothetical protein